MVQPHKLHILADVHDRQYILGIREKNPPSPAQPLLHCFLPFPNITKVLLNNCVANNTVVLAHPTTSGLYLLHNSVRVDVLLKNASPNCSHDTALHHCRPRISIRVGRASGQRPVQQQQQRPKTQPYSPTRKDAYVQGAMQMRRPHCAHEPA